MKGLGALPSVDNLRCFLAAAEHLNFRRAAEEVALTATAFGQRIQQIEDQLDQRLFERTTRRVELTSAGRRLVPVARSVLREARRAMEVVHAEADPPASFTVGTRFELGLSWILPAVVDMRDERPNWDVDLYFGSGPDILERLRGGQIDCVITSAPIAEREWAAEFLHPERYVFVAAPDYLKERPFEDRWDSEQHALIDIDASLPLTRYLTSAVGDMEFASVWLAGTGAAMRRLVLDGHGVCVLPQYMVDGDLKEGRLVRLLPEAELLEDSFRLLYRAASPLAGVFQLLADYMRGRPLE
jgi:DNA-binding transcriptional LysR family regulator